MAIIELEGVSYVYGAKTPYEMTAIKNIDLKIEEMKSHLDSNFIAMNFQVFDNPEYQKLINQSKPMQVPEIVAPRRSSNKDGVVIDGIDNCLIKLSRCW